MKAINARADALAISRSEFLEQFARGVAGMNDDSELTKEDRESACKSPGIRHRSISRRTRLGKGLFLKRKASCDRAEFLKNQIIEWETLLEKLG